MMNVSRKIANNGVMLIFLWALILIMNAGIAEAYTLSSCGTISAPGTYALTSNLVSSTSCITITSSNVVLDGKDPTTGIKHTITAGGDAIYIDAPQSSNNNILIKNIISSSGVSNYYPNPGNGVTIEESDLGTVTIWRSDDFTIKNSKLRGLTLRSNDFCPGSDPPLRARIINNTIIGSSEVLVYLQASDCSLIIDTNHVIENNTIINNYPSTTTPSGVPVTVYMIRGVANNIIKNNTIISSNTIPLYLRDGADRNIIDRNYIETDRGGNRGALFFGSGGPYPSMPSNNIFRNNTFIGRNSGGINTQGWGAGNVFDNNVFWGNRQGTTYGSNFVTSGTGGGHIFRHNTFYNSDNSQATLILGGSSGNPNTFTSNIFASTSSAAISCEFSSGINIYSGNSNVFHSTAGTATMCGYSLSGWRTATGDDANSIEANPLFVNAAAGDFRLQSSSPACSIGGSYAGAYSCGGVPANMNPSAALSANPTSGTAPLSVSFSAVGSSDPDGDALTYFWNFGDGQTGSGISTSHAYTVAGTYTAVLTVTDGRGGSATASSTITVFGPPDTTPPAITSIQSTSITDTSATITWTTNEQSSSVVNYGTSSGSYPSTATGTGGVTSHSVLLSGLSSGTAYFYRVTSADPSGNSAQSAEQTFTTAAPSSSCGISCAGCTANRILGTACNPSNRLCDGTNSVENIRLSSIQITAGSPLTATIDYACYGSASSSTDNIALWYYNGASWRRLQTWGNGNADGNPNILTGCDTLVDGADGSVTFTFTPDSVTGISHYVRAVEADGLFAGSSQCPSSASQWWGNIDDMAFSVTSQANRNPVAAFSASPLSGTVPLSVLFNGASSSDPDGDALTYSWNFGDGQTAPGVLSNHIYSAAGNYIATLTVNDGIGGSGSATVQISVSSQPANRNPVAAISASPASGTAPLTVSFSGSGSSDPDGDALTYSWNFGDGTTGSGISVSHVYAAGTYTISLTVNDGKGGSGSATLQIIVSSPAITCTDTDSATYPTINDVVQGTVSVQGGPYTDTCIDAIQLTEYYCQSSASAAVSSQITSCANGCVNGRCSAVDLLPPSISNIQKSLINSSSVSITWTTDEPSMSLVKYGTSSGVYANEAVGAGGTSHSVSLSGLSPSTPYYFVVNSTDASGNSVQSAEQSFTSLATYFIQFVSPTLQNGEIISDKNVTIKMQSNNPLPFSEFTLNFGPVPYKLPNLLSCNSENNYSCDAGDTATSTGTIFVAGKFGQGILVDAADTLMYPSLDNINANEGTIMFWITPNTNWLTASGYVLLDMYNDAAGTGLFAWKASGADSVKIVRYADTNTSVISAPSALFAQGTWKHVAIAYGNGKLELYINGTLIKSVDSSGIITAFNDGIYLGQRRTGISQANAVFDEFKIYGRKLAPADISNIHDKESGTYYMRLANLADNNYAYSANAIDSNGNQINSEARGFAISTMPPVVSDIQASLILQTSAVITWGTNEKSSSLVRYGLVSGIYTNQATDANGTLHSVYLSGLASSMTYYFVVNSTNSLGNSAQSPEQQFTTTGQVIGPTDGGGGGGGGGSTTTLPSVTQTVASISANVPTAVTIAETKLPVSRIELTTSTNVQNVQLTVKEVSKPSGAGIAIAADAGKVYKYVEITTTISSKLSKAKIKFKIEKAWFTNNKIDSSTAALNRLAGTTWTKLSTPKISEDATNIYYEAETAGFSTFAITGEKVKAPAAAVCGNGIIESGEECDENQFAGQTCITKGFTGGTLECASCRLGTSSCTTAAQPPGQLIQLPQQPPVEPLIIPGNNTPVIIAIIIIVIVFLFVVGKTRNKTRPV